MTYINKDTASKERNIRIKHVLLAIRELNQMGEINDKTRDLVAFIAINLSEIHNGIDASVVAWEKRGYWVKADKYRMDWMWTKNISDKLTKALSNDNFADVIASLPVIFSKLETTTLAKSAKLPDEYVGAYVLLKKAGQG
jgi:hypothetical protein